MNRTTIIIRVEESPLRHRPISPIVSFRAIHPINHLPLSPSQILCFCQGSFTLHFCCWNVAMFTVTEYNVTHLEPLSCHLNYKEGMDDQCTFNLSNSTFSSWSHKQWPIGLSFSSLSPPYFSVSITTTTNLKTPYFIGFLILDFISIITIAAFLVGICILCFKSRNRHGDYKTL